jgi:hypothetical protein
MPTREEVEQTAHVLVGGAEAWESLTPNQKFSMRQVALTVLNDTRATTTGVILDWLLERFEDNPSPMVDIAADAVKFERFRLDEESSDD